MIATWIIAEAPGTVQTIMSFFVKGGLFMWPLLVCSIVSVTTIILRGIALREKNVMPLEIQNEIERLAPGESPERLSRIVHHDPSSLARIARVALQHLRGPRSENVEVVETRARHEMVRLEKGLIVLEVITGIAPLIGLIGAVSGLVHVFASWFELGRNRYASDRARHRRSVECNRVRTFDRGSDFDRLQLFLEESGSDVGGNGNSCRRVNQQMLLWARLPRSDAGKIFTAGSGAHADASSVKRTAHFTL